MDNNKVIIALDFSNVRDTMDFLNLFGEIRPFVKIGMELFYAEGAGIVKVLRARGHKIFLDLKLHDIPNTVKKTMRVLSAYGVDMVNLHATGTKAMMTSALEGATRPDGSRPAILAVTQLTSTNEEVMQRELLISATMEETVIKYAGNAKEAGLDGVVCSPWEANKVHNACGNNFLTVTPGIRFADSGVDDQSRIAPPDKAKQMGCDYIVVGRPITQAQDPVNAYLRCINEFK
ncbi:MAG: orotidine-5'-phosphate decarboxylase [Clostridiales bacterium]|jgi:orotidine-5'-phosphate decarboxylase|nr:orotidine-5'-phosphate decarboxylase [Clostridiales bacterium]